jgi:hypothetical protein
MSNGTGDGLPLTGNKKIFPGKHKSVMMNEMFGKVVSYQCNSELF